MTFEYWELYIIFITRIRIHKYPEEERTEDMDHTACGQLEKVRRIEEKRMAEIPAETRPVFHMSSPVGWMNDPNGFSVYKGEYHLFFQYHPYSNVWGPMHWGHCKSRDFVRWEYLPAAMAPDESYDNGGCYSGSAIEKDGEHVLVYTGVIDRYLEDGTKDYRQVQCVAKGDGVNYHKFKENPVITGESLPPGSSTEDFRDPKVWKEEDGYYLAAGSRAADGCGQILLYRSENMRQWEFVAILDASRGEYGRMWECPDFFPLGDRQILMVSPQDMRAKGFEFHNGNNSIFLYGSYDKETHRFRREEAVSVDYGLDFYAPQTLETPDGRRIMVGWMQSWDAHIMKDCLKWSGMMTVPRELELRGGRVFQNPVRELEKYRQNRVEHKRRYITGLTGLEGIRGRVADLLVEITGFDFQHFTIHFAHNEEYDMFLQYNSERKCLTIDRTSSGVVRDVICRRKMTAEPVRAEGQEAKLSLRILLDRYSVEVFVNGGEKVMSSVFYTPMEADGILFDTDGTARINVIKYDICV